jgi:hypothetical protein
MVHNQPCHHSDLKGIVQMQERGEQSGRLARVKRRERWALRADRLCGSWKLRPPEVPKARRRQAMSRRVQQQISHTGLGDGRRDDSLTAKATPVPFLCRGERDDNLVRGMTA